MYRMHTRTKTETTVAQQQQTKASTAAPNKNQRIFITKSHCPQKAWFGEETRTLQVRSYVNYLEVPSCCAFPNQVVADEAGLHVKPIGQKSKARPKKTSPKPYVPTPKTTKKVKHSLDQHLKPEHLGPWSPFAVFSRTRCHLPPRRHSSFPAPRHECHRPNLPTVEQEEAACRSARIDSSSGVLIGGRDGESASAPDCVVMTAVIDTITDASLPRILYTAVFKHLFT